MAGAGLPLNGSSPTGAQSCALESVGSKASSDGIDYAEKQKPQRCHLDPIG
jgi:hypothetical protein